MINFKSLEKLIASDNHNLIDIGDIPTNRAFEQMLERLDGARNLDIIPELNRLISTDDLSKIYHYFLNNDSSQTQNFLNEVKTLRPGEGYYLDKEHSGLARTVTILLSLEGEYKVILETKSKIVDGSKQQFFKPSGAFKRGGPAWRIDGEAKKYFNAVVKREHSHGELNPLEVPDYIAQEFAKIKQETELSHQFGLGTVQITDLGPIHSKNRKKVYRRLAEQCEREEIHYKISVYSEHSHGNLRELIYDLQGGKITLSEQQINIMILDLIQAIKEIHDKNYVHQDIKPENILVFKNAENNYRLKLTDLGETKKHKDPETTIEDGTKYYQSPEILMSRFTPDILKRYDQFAYQEAFKNFDSVSDEKKEKYKRPHKANDLWGLGTVIWELKYLEFHPKSFSFWVNFKIYRDPLLYYLFNDRKSRIDIDKALELHQKEMGLAEERLNESCYTIMF